MKVIENKRQINFKELYLSDVISLPVTDLERVVKFINLSRKVDVVLYEHYRYRKEINRKYLQNKKRRMS